MLITLYTHYGHLIQVPQQQPNFLHAFCRFWNPLRSCSINRASEVEGRVHVHVSYSLNFLKGGDVGDHIITPFI